MALEKSLASMGKLHAGYKKTTPHFVTMQQQQCLFGRTTGRRGTVKAFVHGSRVVCACVRVTTSCRMSIINTSYQKLPFGSGDDPGKLFFHKALN